MIKIFISNFIFLQFNISATEVEPISGWFDTVNGPTGLVFVCALGINHVVNSAGSNEMNAVPLDVCVKGMIVASYNVWKDKKQSEEIAVYNAASVKCLTYESMMGIKPLVLKNPSMKSIGIPYVTFTKCVYYAWILRIFRNLIPAIIMDGLLCITGNKPK